MSFSLSPMTQQEELLTIELIRYHLLGENNSTETHIENLNFHISHDESLVISEESNRSCSESGSNCLNADPTHCDSLASVSKFVNPDRNCSDYETKLEIVDLNTTLPNSVKGLDFKDVTHYRGVKRRP
ncbi:hypothetical protein LguiA_034698 [Lonicera macranthoides]